MAQSINSLEFICLHAEIKMPEPEKMMLGIVMGGKVGLTRFALPIFLLNAGSISQECADGCVVRKK